MCNLRLSEHKEALFINTVDKAQKTATVKILATYHKPYRHLNEDINPLNAELNSICPLLALLGVHRILHVSRIRVKYCPPTGVPVNVWCWRQLH
jgi:hypothetical protein